MQNKPWNSGPIPASQGSNQQQPDPNDPNIQDEDDDQDLQQYIEMLEQHQNLYEKEGKYIEAEMAKNKLAELKKQLEIQRRDEIKARHINEKAQLEQDHIEEFREFNEFWDQKMAEFNEQARMIEEQTILKHQAEMQSFLEELEISIPNKPKDSPELLNLKKIQQSLAKKKEYIEAHKVQQRCMKLEKEETDKWLGLREKKLLNQKAQFELKQTNELNALRKRINTGQDEQRKARSLELERLLQKYQNIRKELEAQQQLEMLRITNPKAMTGSMFRSQGSRAGRSAFESQSGLDVSTRKR